ncbi:MAG: peroxiredoxin [Bacteroidota bacterium]
MKRYMFAMLVFLISISVFAQEPPKLGDKAPLFTLSYATKDTIVNSGFSLASCIGKNYILLAFYPADWSGGCTKEMCTMRDSFTELSNLGCDVYGISGDYVYSHREWAKHLELQFKLLSDHNHDVAKMYQSYNTETGYNKRTVFVIDKQGKIAYVDLEYKAGTPDSFNKLKAALSKF